MIEDRIRLNASQSLDGSEAGVILNIESGHRQLRLTPAEARSLAAGLLATVCDAEGSDEPHRFDEEYAGEDHAKELQSIRRAQIGSVVPPDGKVIEVGPNKAFFCKACGGWVEIHYRLRNGQARPSTRRIDSPGGIMTAPTAGGPHRETRANGKGDSGQARPDRAKGEVMTDTERIDALEAEVDRLKFVLAGFTRATSSSLLPGLEASEPTTESPAA
jgi:hypothetical protein